MAQYGYSKENSVSPETVAARMVDLVTSAQYPGGSCLEVAAAGSRSLGVWNIAAPSSNGTSVDPAVREANYKPIMEKLNSERG